VLFIEVNLDKASTKTILRFIHLLNTKHLLMNSRAYSSMICLQKFNTIPNIYLSQISLLWMTLTHINLDLDLIKSKPKPEGSFAYKICPLCAIAT
jgi:hypothetical protein